MVDGCDDRGAVTLDMQVTECIEPAGLRVERLARVPYLCLGDTRGSRMYELDDAVLVLRAANEGELTADAATQASAKNSMGASGGEDYEQPAAEHAAL